MDKNQKKEFVKSFKDQFNDIGMLVITHYSGLKTSETDELRSQLRESGGSFKVTKNSLMQLILKENKNKELKELFNGPVAIAYSSDEVSAAKVSVNFSKDHEKLIILGGLMGDKFLTQEEVLEIATLPSLDEIRAKIAALLKTPAQKIAYALNYSATKLARVFNEYSKLDTPQNKEEAKSEEKPDVKENNEDKQPDGDK